MVIVCTVWHYQILFGIPARTASRWLKQDRETLKARRITTSHLKSLYGIDADDIENLRNAAQNPSIFARMRH